MKYYFEPVKRQNFEKYSDYKRKEIRIMGIIPGTIPSS